MILIDFQQKEESDPYNTFCRSMISHRKYRFASEVKKVEEPEEDEEEKIINSKKPEDCLVSARHKTLPPLHPLLQNSSLRERMVTRMMRSV